MRKRKKRKTHHFPAVKFDPRNFGLEGTWKPN